MRRPTTVQLFLGVSLPLVIRCFISTFWNFVFPPYPFPASVQKV